MSMMQEFKAFAVKGHVGVNTVAQITQAAQLQRLQFFAWQSFLFDVEKHGPLLLRLAFGGAKARR